MQYIIWYMQCKMKAFYIQKEPLSDLEWGCVLNQKNENRE